MGQDSGRCVTCMVSYGQGVWVALQGSAQVRLYHYTSYESIAEVDVAPAVHKMLAGTQCIVADLYLWTVDVSHHLTVIMKKHSY